MSKNKNPLHRYHIIDQCLRNTLRQWTRKLLLEEVNKQLALNGIEIIAETQLRNDMDHIQELYGAPVVEKRVKTKILYCYEDPDFSIHNLQVKQEDLGLLNQAVTIMQQIQGFQLSYDIADVVQRLEQRVKLHSYNSQPCISFENAPMALGTDLLGDLYQAIQNKNVLKINYQPFTEAKASSLIHHPYYLKEFNNRWFLFGFNPALNRIDNLALDRMQEVKVIDKPFLENQQFDPVKYFGSIIGVTLPLNAVAEQVVIKVAETRAPYVRSKPLHHSQQAAALPDGSWQFTYTLIPNKELESQLLSFGADAEVLAPESLRSQVADKLREAYRIYYAG